MAKLYFRYGTMDSAKSMNLLAVAHNYRKQGKRVLLLKPRLDTRFGSTTITSRSGLSAEADLLIDPDTVLEPSDFAGLDCILVDEAQFLSPQVVVDLRRITVDPGVLAIGVVLLRIAAVFQLFDGLQGVATGVLRGVGDTRTPMLWNFAGHWLIGLPLGYYLTFGRGWGVFGLWTGLSAGLIIVGALLLVVWMRHVQELRRSMTPQPTGAS